VKGRVLLSGLLGAVVLVLWTFVANAVFGFKARVEMRPVPNERAVYAALKDNVVAPGAFMVNPALTPEGRFPDGEPVFAIRTSGLGHEAAGRMFLVEPALGLLAAMLAALLLAAASPRVLASYPRKVLFVAGLGALLGLSGEVSRVGIGGYPPATGLLLAANVMVGWTLAGLAMAWPARDRAVRDGAAQDDRLIAAGDRARSMRRAPGRTGRS